MRTLSLTICCALSLFRSSATPDTAGKVMWAFPITPYIVPAGDTIYIVQVALPQKSPFIKAKQPGLLRGAAQGETIDTGSKGWGKCHLIKGYYYYFGIHGQNGIKPKAKDLVYTFIPRIKGNYQSPIFYCAAHAITFTDVEDRDFYIPPDFYYKRTKAQDEAIVKEMAADIQRTGKYYLQNDSSLNKLIAEGPFKDRRMLDVMVSADAGDITAFLRYVAARPRRYAGNRWKISETFATWLIAGAPMVEATPYN